MSNTDIKANSVTINGVEYVTKGSIEVTAPPVSLEKYRIVRTKSAGVFAGFIARRPMSGCVVMHNARRLWYWTGAASLSQLAVDGTKTPHTCKFPCEVPEIELMEVIEILRVTPQAKLSIDSVAVWKA
jgi:hypothetical protein